MSKADKFKSLKEDALKGYNNYINKIKKFALEDLQDINKRLNLLSAYNKSVLSNAAYRNFINENVRNSLTKK